jgi:hypothetical protein
MKLLIYSHFFAPSVGGVETIVLSLAPRARRTSRFKRCPAIRNHPGHADFGGQLSGQRASLSRGSPPRFPAAMTTHSKRRRAPRRRARANSALSRLVFAQTAGHRTSRLPGHLPQRTPVSSPFRVRLPGTFSGRQLSRMPEVQRENRGCNFGSKPPVAGVESGFGTLVIEMGIGSLLLWFVISLAILFPAWPVVKSLRGSPWFPVAFMIFWYAGLLLVPMTFAGLATYQDFVLNAYFWLLLGVLFCLPTLAVSTEYAAAQLPQMYDPRIRMR